MTDKTIALHMPTVREIAATLRTLPPKTHRDLSTLLPVSGVQGIIAVLADSIEALPDRMSQLAAEQAKEAQ